MCLANRLLKNVELRIFFCCFFFTAESAFRLLNLKKKKSHFLLIQVMKFYISNARTSKNATSARFYAQRAMMNERAVKFRCIR